MPAAEGSFIGLAIDSGTDPLSSDYMYMLFREGGVGPQSIVVPLDREVGGGALVRSVVRAGVSSAGALDFIPRPKTLGLLLKAILGDCATTGAAGTGYTHVFKLATDQFAIPALKVRQLVNGFQGEEFDNMKVSALSLSFRAARFLEGAVAFVGGEPKGGIDASGWAAIGKVDGGPQFITPTGSIQINGATPLDVLAGSFTVGNNIPLDEQFVIGSNFPKAIDINGRTAMVSFTVKVTDDTLYKKMMYDKSGATGNWVASIFKDGDLKIVFKTDQDIAGAPADTKHTLTIEADAANDNVYWSAQPISLRAGRQILMQVTGIIAASAAAPIKVTLLNDQASY